MKCFDRLPPHWQLWIEEYAKTKSNGEYDQLVAQDFTGDVKLRFSDLSFILFENAFYALDEEEKEIAVFTEHCGYHIFDLTEDLIYH